MRVPFSSWFGRFLVGTLMVVGWLGPANAQSLRLDSPQAVPGGVQLRLHGPANTVHRVDAASRLPFWSPVDLLTATGTVKTSVDPVTNAAVRFYRAVQVEPGLRVWRVSPGVGAPGDEVSIEGQFFVAGQPGENAVSIGGADAVVTAATATRLTIRVPVDAQSGALVVRTATEGAAAPEAFTVLARVPVRVEPPGGGPADAYTVVNPYGGVGGTGLAIRQGLPLISMAVPLADARGTLLALSINPPPVLVFNAASTAEALVFLHPLFQTSQPQLAARAQTAIHDTPEVGELGRRMAVHFAAGRNPVDQPDFGPTYSNAVQAVFSSGAMQALVRMVRQAPEVPMARGTRAAAAAATSDVADFPVDRDWIEVSRFNAVTNNTIDELFARLSGKVEGAALGPRQRVVRRGQSETYPYFTTVDWVVRIDEVDVERAFPRGRPEFNQAWQQPDSRAVYPVLPPAPGTPEDEAFPRFGAVGARSFNEVTVPLKTLVSYVSGKVVDALSPPNDAVTFPDRDALYRVTAVGPSFASGPEAETAKTAYGDERFRALSLNLISGVFDTCSVLIDLKALEIGPFVAEVSVKLALEAEKKLPGIRQASDLPPAVVDLGKFFLQEYADEWKNRVLEHKLGEAMENGAKVTAANYVTAVAPVLKALDIGGGIGQLALRVRGTAVISPLETTFVAVGDPFRLEFLDVTPGVGQAGDPVTVRFRGPARLAPFGSQGTNDTVEFLGPDFFLGEVQSVTGPDREGVQSVTVRIPAGLPPSADGTYVLSVGTGGRVGRGSFRVASLTLVQALSPSDAFAPTNNFQGFPYAGDSLRLTGVNFNRKDRFWVPTATGEALALNVQDNQPDGDVQLSLPPGAVSGRIRVEHTRPNGGGTLTNHSPRLTILGRPVIESVTPEHGSVGTTVTLRVQNLGTQAATAITKLGGRPVQNLKVLGDALVFTVPAGASGGLIELATPAGQTVKDFTLDAGLATGANIQVGGSSPITLDQAAGLASGALSPGDIPNFDDQDGPGDPPLEPGDFLTDLGVNAVPVRFPLGAAFRDTIAVQGPLEGEQTLRLVRDAFSATVAGTLIVEGEFGSLNLVVDGTVIVRGNNMTLNRPKVRGTLIIEGNQNVLSSPEFRDGPGPGLILRGQGNRITGAEFTEKGGDGLRIEGGRFNQVEVTRSTGNRGHGIVLTEGAEGNEVKFYTGRLLGNDIEPGTGNLGHGLLLLGEARSNSFSHYNGGSSGNDGDGIRLDGPGVTGNRFFGHLCTVNAGNGITITNGARQNSFGTQFATGICRSNQLSGFAIYRSPGTELSSINTGNGTYGLLVSGVDDRVGGRRLLVASGLFSTDGTNGRAGLRLEDATQGVRVDTSIGDLRRNQVGVEIVGAETRLNSVNAVVRETVQQGVVVDGAVNNDLTFNVSTVGGNGVELRGARNNRVRLAGIEGTGQVGLLLVGAQENHVFSSRTDPSTSTVRGATEGILVTAGSQRNVFERLQVSASAGAGLVLRDPGTERNQILRSTLNGSATDGIQILAGASRNRIGDDGPVGANPYRVAMQDNGRAGVRVSGAGTDDNEIRLGNFARVSKQLLGIVIEQGAAGTLVVSNQFLSAPGPGVGQMETAVVVRDGARTARIQQNRFSQLSLRGILVTNATDVQIGGDLSAEGNAFDTQPVGVEIAGPASTGNRIRFNTFTSHGEAGLRIQPGAHDQVVGPGNTFDLNPHGIRVTGAEGSRIHDNRLTRHSLAAVQIEAGARAQQVFGNTIQDNAAGIRADGAGTQGNRWLDNVLTGNAGLGIELLAGANHGIQPPQFTALVGDQLSGVADVPDGSQVQVFRDAGDEGALWLGDAWVFDQQFNLTLPVDPWSAAQSFRINATVTDPEGNTSAFSESYGAGQPSIRVVWSSTRDGNAELYLRDAAHPGGLRLTTQAGTDGQPSLSRNGTQLLFVSDRVGNREIYRQEPRAGMTAVRLTTQPAADYDPVWSPDGTQIAFTSERDGPPALFRMQADGSQPVRLLPVASSGRWPSWSPDGQWIAYSRQVGDRWQLALIRPDGSGDQLLGGSAANDTQPVWSPDGLRLAFVSEADGNPELYWMRFDGSERRRLTTDLAADRDPSWLPDGQGLVFASERSGLAELYVIPVTGGAVRRWTVGSGLNAQPTTAGVP
jgi:Tol biopolymer transport system component